jgi:hypothetical protein
VKCGAFCQEECLTWCSTVQLLSLGWYSFHMKVIHIAGPDTPQHCSRCGIAFKVGDEGADGWPVGARVAFVGEPGFHEEMLEAPLLNGEPSAESLGAVDCQ